jgi:riboflavin kinase/FMN adenylyltransferase
MQIVRGLPPVPPEPRPSAVALGVFDGVHLGHRVILGTAVAHGREAAIPAVACTFDPHPMEVLQPGRAPLAITTLEERLALIEGCGLDAAVVLPFTPALAAMEPEAFVKDVLIARLSAREIVVGFNHRFGRGARGDVALLRSLGDRLGFRTHVAEPLMVEGVAVSSTEIRAALQRGDLAAARWGFRPRTWCPRGRCSSPPVCTPAWRRSAVARSARSSTWGCGRPSTKRPWRSRPIFWISWATYMVRP